MEKLDIVPRLRRIVEKARNGMPPVGIETLLEAADEIERLRQFTEREIGAVRLSKFTER